MARILMLTPQLPYPPQQGTSLRNYHMLRALSERHDVSLLSYSESSDMAGIGTLEAICRVLPPVSVPTRTSTQRAGQLMTTRQPDMAWRLHSRIFADALAEALGDHAYDFVQVEGIELTWAIPIIREVGGATRVVLDCHNVETELQRRAFHSDLRRPSRWPAAAYSSIQVGRLARYERWALRAADAVLAVSETDRRLLSGIMAQPGKSIVVIPNLIDVEEYQWDRPIPAEAQQDLAFTGKMDYRPNVDGVLWFAEEIWPFIAQRRPGTTWAVVGQRPHARLSPLRDLKGVTLTGWVEHVQPFLAGAQVIIMPLRIGSGTRLKLIEAMAAGCAIVSTHLGAEGVDVLDGRDLLLADTPEAFAVAVLELLADPLRRTELGRQARRLAEQYDWRHQIPALESIYG